MKYIPIIIIFTLTCLFFGKTLVPKNNQILSSGDIKQIHYPYREFLRNALFSGQIPFWNPYVFSGLPFLAHPYTAFAYPTTLSSIFLPSNIYFSIVSALHLFIAGVSMYYLLKKFTDSYSALTGAIIFAFNGYFAARIYAGHIDYITSTALIPFIFLAAYEYIFENRKRSLFWGSIVLCFQIFTGLINMVFYTFLIISIFNLFLTKPARKNLVNNLTKIFVFFFFGFGLSAIYLLPSFQFISQTIRGTRLDYGLTSLGSATFQTLALFLNPQFLGSDFTPANPFHGPPPNYHEYIYFAGVTPLIIIFLGIVYHLYKKAFDKKILALLIIITLAILISLGPNSPFNLHLILWFFLNIYQTTRFPVRHLIMVVFALSFLTSLILTRLKSIPVKIILFIAITAELFAFGKKFIYLSPKPQLLPEYDRIVNEIVNKKELVRILPDFTLNSPVRGEISFASPLTFKYFSTSGYTPAILSTYYNFVDLINGNVVSSLDRFNSEITPSVPYLAGISFLNAKYIIVDNTVDLLSERKDTYILLLETPLYRIYQAKNYLPRFFFVKEAKIYKDRSEVENNLNRDQQDFKNKIFITTSTSKNITYQPDCSNHEDVKIDVVKYEINKIILKGNFPCNGFLSSSESYFQGWEAKIDEKNTPVMVSNLSFRALNIPKGNHTITFYYQPTIYFIGGLISLIFFVVLILITRSTKLLPAFRTKK
ncbi:hypothetical protein A2960_03725 [Candidatus Gottesmanbacteria bacterium RIFCSPLOWO2_01_FULL_39_12b]|uniref:Membrane protein 6-pyruvoyl-tetrahydropterin synthase-related domain-containing protein n=1 Tax=Candidatus Gottesmanbacteria bacterium RIFCSPLOWO2_01_FULL_39_12b TaxID=1798388 RepID=A0A1F6APF4_9BACT|nr:MAG: hypothetical protein A2960_03725 [Candidatus Gottesmanbacteria bacterium RIFCSPLOWO2_01_FULL_39_12b]